MKIFKMDDHYRYLNKIYGHVWKPNLLMEKTLTYMGDDENMSGLGWNVYRKKVYNYPMSPFNYWGTPHVSLWKILMKGMHKIFIQGGCLEQHVEVCRFIVHYIYNLYET